MIIAGIDEAGLGPALGPLCACASVFEVDEYACPWQSYNKIATAHKSGKQELLVTDSKIAYSRAGLHTLENSALSFICSTDATPDIPANLHDLLAQTTPQNHNTTICQALWYQSASNESVPHSTEPEQIENNSQSIKSTPGISCKSIDSILLSAAELNRLLDKGLNKSEAVMLQTGKLIKNIYDKFSDQEIIITVDKQGGRNFYAPFLMDVLEGAWITPVVEGADLSEYTCARMRIIFKPKADRDSFATALSSIYAKYLRERFMQMFNDFFALHVKDLAPTAGYHGDAPRFFEQITPAMKKLDIKAHEIWRNK